LEKHRNVKDYPFSALMVLVEHWLVCDDDDDDKIIIIITTADDKGLQQKLTTSLNS